MNIFYETDNIILSLFTEEELNSAKYQSWFYDPDVTKYNSHGLFPYTKEKQKVFMDSIETNEKIVFAIYVLTPEYFIKEGRVEKSIYIGNISLQSINWIYKSAEIAWVIGEKEYWGKGIATEAGNLVLCHGFNKLNLHRIWSGTAATNKGMQRVFEKLKFKKEGIFIDGMFLNGEYVDIYNYAITDQEWRTYGLGT